MQDKNSTTSEETRQFDGNPYDPERMNPEDVMRHFFVDEVPILPVVSKSGALLGILKKDDLVSELSDLDRVKKQKTDQLVQKLLKKMTLDDLLPFVTKHREFSVINVFGEHLGKWSRLQLLEASESSEKKKQPAADINRQKDQEMLEWIIYSILEHIPRPLYALNNNGKTMFYNGHFEDLIVKNLGEKYDIAHVENLFTDPEKNDFYYNDNEDILFYNQEFNIYYEKIPMKSNDKQIGFLVFCDKESNIPVSALVARKNLKKQSLDDRIRTIEKIIISETIKEKNNNIDEAAKALHISKKNLLERAGKHGIDAGRKKTVKKK